MPMRERHGEHPQPGRQAGEARRRRSRRRAFVAAERHLARQHLLRGVGEEQVGRQVPDPLAPRGEGPPAGHVVGVDLRHLAVQIVGRGPQVERRPVGPGEAGDGVEAAQGEVVFEPFARGGEEVLEHEREGEQAGAGVEAKGPVAGPLLRPAARPAGVGDLPEVELPADAVVLFQQGDAEARGVCGQADRRRQPADAAADDDHLFGHGRGEGGSGLRPGAAPCGAV